MADAKTSKAAKPAAETKPAQNSTTHEDVGTSAERPDATSDTQPEVQAKELSGQDRVDTIMGSIDLLDAAEPTHWLGRNPSAEALSEMIGFEIGQEEVNAVYAGNFAPKKVETAPIVEKIEGDWGVKDKNATMVNAETGEPIARVHEPLPGRFVKLHAAHHETMPRSLAMKFLCDPSFEVINENGQVVPALTEGAADRGADLVTRQLKPHQVIADLDELVASSLLARAAQHPGGERFDQDTDRDILVRFIEQKHMLAARQRRQQSMLTDGNVEEMDDSEVDGLLGPQNFRGMSTEAILATVGQ